MGFVDDDSDSEAEGNTLRSQLDEEANLANNKDTTFGNRPSSHRTSSPNDPRTRTRKDNDLLTITRLRRKGITESEEIWGELEDGVPGELSPLTHRRSSARSTPSKTVFSRGYPMDESPNESTALLARSGTGRSYRDRRMRRSTVNLETPERDRRRKSASSQDAIGGWWKMTSWWRGKGRRDKGKGTGYGNENGSGDSAYQS